MANGNRIQLWGCSNNNPNQRWDTGYMFPAQPDQSQVGQTGTNNCRGGSGPDSNCQTLGQHSLPWCHLCANWRFASQSSTRWKTFACGDLLRSKPSVTVKHMRLLGASWVATVHASCPQVRSLAPISSKHRTTCECRTLVF